MTATARSFLGRSPQLVLYCLGPESGLAPRPTATASLRLECVAIDLARRSAGRSFSAASPRVRSAVTVEIGRLPFTIWFIVGCEMPESLATRWGGIAAGLMNSSNRISPGCGLGMVWVLITSRAPVFPVKGTWPCELLYAIWSTGTSRRIDAPDSARALRRSELVCRRSQKPSLVPK